MVLNGHLKFIYGDLEVRKVGSVVYYNDFIINSVHRYVIKIILKINKKIANIICFPS